MVELHDFYSVRQARDAFEAELGKGTECPCCGRFGKEYRRKLNSGMALTLIRIYKSQQREWIHVKEYLRMHEYKNSHDWTLLKYWGLLEPKIAQRDDGSDRNGFHRITQKGIDFVEAKINVQSHIFLYNSGFLGFSGNMVSIRDALGRHFNYDELMEKQAMEDIYDKERV
jgi:hypothetical protein